MYTRKGVLCDVSSTRNAKWNTKYAKCLSTCHLKWRMRIKKASHGKHTCHRLNGFDDYTHSCVTGTLSVIESRVAIHVHSPCLADGVNELWMRYQNKIKTKCSKVWYPIHSAVSCVSAIRTGIVWYGNKLVDCESKSIVSTYNLMLLLFCSLTHHPQSSTHTRHSRSHPSYFLPSSAPLRLALCECRKHIQWIQDRQTTIDVYPTL